MKKTKFNKRYLASVIPLIFISGCNSSSTTLSSITPTPTPTPSPTPTPTPGPTATPTITFSTSGLSQYGVTGRNESFIVVAKLNSNGNIVTSQTIESLSLFGNGVPINNESITFGPSCQVSSSGPESCSIAVNIGLIASVESYMLTMTNVGAGSVSLINESIPFSVGLRIFVTSGTHNGNFSVLGTGPESGFNGANNFCINDSNNPYSTGNGNWIALMGYQDSTIVGTIYYKTNFESIALATTTMLNGTNGGGSGRTNVAIGYVGGKIWTGPRANNCSNWTSGEGSKKANVGTQYNTTGAWWTGNTSACNKSNPLYCVEQP